MRAVALADESVQKKIANSFVPLQVVIEPGTEQLPLDWDALGGWRRAFRVMGGDECEGFTGCSVVTPDLETELGNTGSAFVWEMFDSIAYDAEKFAAMLDAAAERWAERQRIESDEKLSRLKRWAQLRKWRSEVRTALRNGGRTRLPPKGFSKERALELFRLTGDVPESEPKSEPTSRPEPPQPPRREER